MHNNTLHVTYILFLGSTTISWLRIFIGSNHLKNSLQKVANSKSRIGNVPLKGGISVSKTKEVLDKWGHRNQPEGLLQAKPNN
jgi:hypothetical protein